MTDLQRRIAALSPEQRARLEERLAEMAAARGHRVSTAIKPRDRDRPTPLAIQQQREWTFAQFQSITIPGAFRVEGELDEDLLRRVLAEVVERHEILRSTVEMQSDGTMAQVVHPTTSVPVPIVDLSHLADDEQRAELRESWQSEVQMPFDPGEPLRLRVRVFRLAEQTHVVFITADHVAADAFSVGLLVREFATLYVGAPLDPLEIQYGDFAAWQRSVEAERIDDETRHWQETLAGIPAGLGLPTDRPYPARPTFAGASHLTELPAAVSTDLRRLGEREGASPGILLLAACAVLLHRYTGRDDVVIGENVAGRNRAELEPLIGCFVGALPMRMRLTDEQTLAAVVRQARDTVVTAYDHQDLPVDGMLDRLGLGLEAASATLFDMWLDVRTPERDLEVPGLRISAETIETDLIAATPLTLDADPNGDTLRLQWIYMTELFDAETMQVLADQFVRILRAFVDAPDTTVGDLPLAVAPASPAAVEQTPDAARDDAPGFVELFQRRVAQAPFAPAVVHDGVPTSYDELNRSANRLAHRLRALGVDRDTTVGILVDRSPRLAVSIVGVLKAGAAYLPIDAAYPAERIAGMLADAGVRVLVSEERLASIGADSVDHTVLVDDGAGGPDTDLPGPDPDAPAYVVFTSGSTGRPKGTVIEHRSLVTYARDVVDRLGLGAGDRFLQFASPSFDVLAEELFPTWLAGGCVVIPARSLLSGGEDLTALIEREWLTVIELPTAYWHEWVRELDRTGRRLPRCLRLVIIGGEPVLADRLAMWRKLDVPLMNCYGLTETTVTSTFFRLDPAGPVVDWPNLPIGTPLPSADLRVLDHRLRPVPLGGTGELYIGGVSVGRGYVGQPGLTAHRFVADPDPARPGRRLYRTGDLIRRRVDGNLEFVARVDRQVKIRGFRVEPLEIESVLSRHPGVAETVVSVHEPAPGDRRLIAYVVPGPDGMPDLGELRRYLDGELPAYLVPAAFVQLDAIPLTANGKVDRDRLPAPDEGRPDVGPAYAAPQSPIERTLAGIVSAVVGVDPVGVDDNFFEIGGDSILAIQVVARAQEAGLRLSPQDLFAHPTIATLAVAASAAPTIDAEQADVIGPVPVAPSQRWFGAAAIAEARHWNRSVVLDLPALIEPELIETAVEHLMGHHDGLRQRILLAGPDRMRVRIAPRGDLTPFSGYDLTDLDEAAQRRRMDEVGAEIQAGLDPAVGPLIRFAWFRCGGGQPDRLAIVAHRLVADAWSMRILVEDLGRALASLAAGEPVALPPKTTSWQSWVRRLVAYGRTPAVQEQRAFWAGLVASAGDPVPADRQAEPEADTAATEQTITVALDAPRTAELLAAPEALNCEIDELLLTALGRTMRAWSGAGRHLVDVERPARAALFDDVDLGRTVGWVSQTHPLPLTGDPDDTPETSLKAVKEALRAVPADGVGWSLLRFDPEPVPAVPVELAFTYLGDVDPPGFTSASAPVGPDVSPRGRRPYPIAVEASLAGGALVVRWRYSEIRHDQQTMQVQADSYLAELEALIEAARQPAETTHSPTDFPLARVDQSRLDALLSRL
ncbi:amino acid adenylation domain-containing protein [Micromonospora profundi]|uniref:Amino acid adenylation domain-containing protein n=1 Tax=Micromonospora profundi TaxID=1420889 RepID=A0AAJ6HWB2_9ACTN|nr:non-ribosomal peptide synthetase [Micromonospora profundi]WLS48455.1 amino acid adenylation domain-containing protein [Micromonospora profundi]